MKRSHVAWILGVLLAGAAGIINAMWLETTSVLRAEEDSEAASE